MIVGTRYSPELLQDDYDAIVIGSGMGGMSNASILAKAGKKVLVLERHYTAGGFTHSFKRKGYEWDTGLHYIGNVHNPYSAERIAFDTVTDGELKWAKMDDVFDKMIIGGEHYNYMSGRKAFKEELLKSFPNAKKELDTYVKYLKAASTSMPLKLAERYVPNKLQPFAAKAFAKTTPGSFYSRTTKGVMSDFITDLKLASVLAGQWGDYGLPPGQSSFAIHGAVADHYIDGGNFPVGGPSKIAHAIEKVIKRNGGQVLVSAEVEEIIVRGGRAVGVRMANGDEVLAKNVVSAAGLYNTYGKMLSDEVGTRYGLKEKLNNFNPSTAHVGLYIGLKMNPDDLGVKNTNMWVYPDYDHDKNVSAFMQKQNTNFPLTYISFPSAKDPSWSARYPGKATIDVIAPMPYEWFKQWENSSWKKRGEEYENFKAEIADRLLEEVYKQVPQARGNVDYYELSTPLSTQHFNNYAHGELYGLDHTPERFAQSWVKPKTPIKGLYITGQDVFCCGVVPAMLTGIMTAATMLGPQAAKVMPDFFPAKIKRNQKRNARLDAVKKIEKPKAQHSNFLATCIEVESVTDDVKAFRFKKLDDKALDYIAGQFVTLELEIDGKKVFRSYTMSSSPTRPDSFEVTVKRVEGGLVSNWMCDHLQGGQEVQMTGPYGKFVCEPKPPKKLLLLSAGSGVTPMLAMSRSLQDQGSHTDIQFLHIAKTKKDIIFADELQSMHDNAQPFDLHVSLTRAANDKQSKDWQGLQGYLDADMLKTVAVDYKDREVFICGPEAFMDGTEELLKGAGFPMQRFHKESFGSVGDLNAEGGSVYFADTDQEISCTGEQTILDVAEQAGIVIESACRTGDCGECKARCVDGNVVVANSDGLEQGEVDDGYVLTCVSSVNGKVTIAA